MSVVRVTCGIIIKDGKILAARRSQKMKLPLKWEFPGGKLQEDETEEECLKREIKEELNIEISIEYKLPPVRYDYPDVKIELIPFVAKYVGGTLQLHEHEQANWYTKEQLLGLDWAPADVPILNITRLCDPRPDGK